MAKRTSNETQELFPDAWERFENAVRVVAKSPPQHRAKGGGKGKKPRKTPKRAKPR